MKRLLNFKALILTMDPSKGGKTARWKKQKKRKLGGKTDVKKIKGTRDIVDRADR